MRRHARLILAALLVLAVPALADRAGAATSGADQAADVKTGGGVRQALTMTPDQLKWVATPDVPGVMTATAWGDPDKGPHGAFHKFPAGFSSPLHTHSSELRGVVISGTMAMVGEDGKEMPLPAGSYFHQPGNFKHVTKCESGSECVAFVVASGKFDLKPAEGKK